jgi:hypothetical protein
LSDAHTSQRDPSAVVTSAAYLLFYRRREPHPLGGPILEKALTETEVPDSEGEETDPAVPGEGRRLGDSSHNGSSSALLAQGAGRVHRVGDGGSAAIRAGLSQGHGLRNSIEMNDDDDERLPDYAESQAVGAVRVNPLNINSVSGVPTPPAEDEAVDMEFAEYEVEHATVGQWAHVPTQQEQVDGWSFDRLEKQPMNSPGRSSNDSTRVEGNAGSEGSVDEGLGFGDVEEMETDAAMFSDVHDASFGDGRSGGAMRRGIRESAPPPMEQEVEMVRGNEDSDDDLPVAEILPPA